MKKFYVFLFFSLTSLSLLAQNIAPVVSNVKFSVLLNVVTVTYDVLDAEGDEMTVYLRASSDGGSSFDIVPVAATGDIGPGITSGTGKSITWVIAGGVVFNPSSLVYRVIADDEKVPTIEEIISKIDSTRIMQFFDVVFGNNHAKNPTRYDSVRTYLKDHYTGLGYQLYTDNFTFLDNNDRSFVKQGMNIVGKKEGLVDPNRSILFSGHYDTIDTTFGANDNNIAVAVMLEAASVLKNYSFKKSAKFANWDFEEDGLVGATLYAFSPNSLDVQAVLNFDGIGTFKTEPNSQKVPTGFDLLFPEAHEKASNNQFRGDFITIIADIKSAFLNQQVVAAAEQFTPDLNYIDLTCPDPSCLVATDLRRSDHAPFWDRAVPSVFFTATTEFRDSCYHRPCDTVINFWFATEVIRLATSVFIQLAEPMNAGFAQSNDIPTSVKSRVDIAGYSLKAPYPNPVQRNTFLELNLGEDDFVAIRVVDVQGKVVADVYQGELQKGNHIIAWQAMPDFPEGYYFIRTVSKKGFSRTFPLVVTPTNDPFCAHPNQGKQ